MTDIATLPADAFSERVDYMLHQLRTQGAGEPFILDAHAIITRLRSDLERERATAGRLRDALEKARDWIYMPRTAVLWGLSEILAATDAALAASREDGK